MTNGNINYINLVALFHKFFDHPIEPTPVIPASNRCALRYNLLKEEVMEFERAFEKDDIVEVADALADTMYVLCGAILEFGLADKFPAIFVEVQRSNMSKADKTYEDALLTQDYHEQGTEQTKCHIQERDGLFFCTRISDGKTMKSKFYSPADIKGVLDGSIYLEDGKLWEKRGDWYSSKLRI